MFEESGYYLHVYFIGAAPSINSTNGIVLQIYLGMYVAYGEV